MLACLIKRKKTLWGDKYERFNDGLAADYYVNNEACRQD
jgi:hypothetical protein